MLNDEYKDQAQHEQNTNGNDIVLLFQTFKYFGSFDSKWYGSTPTSGGGSLANIW